jgi:O-antigen ligase
MGIAAIRSIDKLFLPINIGRTISVISMFLFGLLIAGIMTLAPDLSTVVPELFGKDTSFSGRSDLWEYLFSEREINMVLGSGYESFWVPENNRIMALYEVFTWIPLQAHNGYIDILLSTGYIGMAITIMMILGYFLKFIQVKKPHPWILFILIVIIFNFQESTLLRIGQRLNTLFILSYLILFINKYKNFSWLPQAEKNQHQVINNSRYKQRY